MSKCLKSPPSETLARVQISLTLARTKPTSTSAAIVASISFAIVASRRSRCERRGRLGAEAAVATGVMPASYLTLRALAS